MFRPCLLRCRSGYLKRCKQPSSLCASAYKCASASECMRWDGMSCWGVGDRHMNRREQGMQHERAYDNKRKSLFTQREYLQGISH